MAPQGKGNQETIDDLKGRNHKIIKGKANGMIRRYQGWRQSNAGRPQLPESVAFRADTVKELLNHPHAFGLRIYPAITDKNELTFVLVAFDENLLNITYPPGSSNSVAITETGVSTGDNDHGALDEAQTCPPYNAPGTV